MSQELVNFSEAHGLEGPRASGLLFLGWALSQSGDSEVGIAHQEQGLAMMAKMGMRVHLTFFLSLLAESLLMAGRYSEGLHQLDRAIKISEEEGERCYLPRLHQLRSDLRLRAYGRADPAVEKSLHEALAIARHQGAKGWEIGAATRLARLWGEQGRRMEAHDLLQPIYAWFTEGFDMPLLSSAKTVLDDLK
jgi:predicted ATPase